MRFFVCDDNSKHCQEINLQEGIYMFRFIKDGDELEYLKESDLPQAMKLAQFRIIKYEVGKAINKMITPEIGSVEPDFNSGKIIKAIERILEKENFS